MRITPLLLCFAVVTALAGCVAIERKIEFSGERIKVTSESKEAAKLFYEAYELYRPYHGDHTFGNDAFPASTTIIAHRKTAEHMRRFEAEKSFMLATAL